MRAFLLLLGLVAVALVPAADGCGIPWHHGQPVSVSAEDALIVWDSATKTEHFIRRANFTTEAKDFGFLVPTPTQPQLSEADDGVFTALAAATAPKIIYEHRTQTVYRNAGAKTAPAAAAPMPQAAVEVLDRKTLAGYDAVVLKANDPKALRDWLDKNGYDARPELVAWFQWYTDHNWIITAFKMTKDGSRASQLMGRTVRLTFQADAPFYPYREPADMRPTALAPGQRMLRVYFLSDKRYAGTLGQGGQWPGQAVWSNASPDDTTKAAFAALGFKDKKEKDDLIAKKWRLTEFEDKSYPRPGTDDVYFRADAGQGTLEKPPVVVPVYDYQYADGPEPGSSTTEDYAFPILVGVLAVVVGAIGLVGWLLMRK